MNPKAVYKYCKHLGCCEACCLRYMGIKNPNAYENVANFVLKYQDEVDKPMRVIEQSQNIASKITDTKENLFDVSIREDLNNSNGNSLDINGADRKISNGDSDTNPPPSKRRKLDICVSCLGVLQEDNWMEGYVLVKDILFKKRYECATFACALSAPITTLLRERAITLRLADEFPGYDDKILTALKEAWKWSFGVKLATEINKTLDSGAISPLLITLNYDYADDLQELEILKQVSPQLFEERSKQKRRFVTEFTRRSVEQALQNASLQSLRAAGGGLACAGARAMCVGAVCTHAPNYLAGRYIKLSRHLPQSPWILEGKRVLPSSVQEIIYKPLADLYNLAAEPADGRLKLIAAGREDVDVRCLGEGRPFAIEITDPTRQLTPEELASACEHISKSGEVIVKQIVPITREDLIQLKKGEETKSKTYEAICIKLSHSKYDDVSPDSPIKVTPEDLARINSFRNTARNTKDTENNIENSKSICNISGGIKDTTDNLDNCESMHQDDKDTSGVPLRSPDNFGTVKEPNSQDVKDATDILDNSTPLKVKLADNPDNPNDDKNNEIDLSVNVLEIKNRETDAESDIVDTLKSDQNVLDSPDSSRDFLDTSVEVRESENRNNCEDIRIMIQQKTPIRVLHRRPLLTRTRHILELKAVEVPDHPQLFRMFVRTSAGTYVKEWAHGELGRSRPSLGDVLGTKVDMLALDVTAVHLQWPPQ